MPRPATREAMADAHKQQTCDCCPPQSDQEDWLALLLDGRVQLPLEDLSEADNSLLSNNLFDASSPVVEEARSADPLLGSSLLRELSLPSLETLLGEDLSLDNLLDVPAGIDDWPSCSASDPVQHQTAASHQTAQLVAHEMQTEAGIVHSDGDSADTGSRRQTGSFNGHSQASAAAERNSGAASGSDSDAKSDKRLPSAPTSAASDSTACGAAAASAVHACAETAASADTSIGRATTPAPSPHTPAPAHEPARASSSSSQVAPQLSPASPTSTGTHQAGSPASSGALRQEPAVGSKRAAATTWPADIDTSSKRTAAAASPVGLDASSKRAPGAPAQEGEEERRRQARMLRNRESAHLSRQRKKMQADEVDRRNQELQTQNGHLTALVSRLTAENGMLRQQLAAVCQRTGQPMPVAMMLPPMGMQMGVPLGPHPYAAAPGMMLPMPGMVMPMLGGTPKVPIQKLKPARPAAAPKLAPQKPQDPAPPSTSPASPGSQSRKKLKTAAGASTVLLAMFSFMVFFGPFMPAPGGSSGGAGQGQSLRHYAALPAAPHAGGRVLQALPANTSGSDAAVKLVQEVLVDAGGGDDADWAEAALDNSTAAGALALRRTNKSAEGLALQRLKDVGPLALFADEMGASKLPGYRNFPQLAGRVLGAEGFVSPVGCKEVFRFDAGSLADPAAAKRQIKEYVSTMQAFRGRMPRAVPLPPAGQAEQQEQQPPVKRSSPSGPKGTIGQDNTTDPGVIVSILLPTKQPARSGADFTSLDQIYVVVLKPSATYATYSCSLPKPILV